MPTKVVFSGGHEITLREEFDKVNTQLHSSGPGAGLFNRLTGGDEVARVVVYRENVLYIEDYEAAEPFVA